MLVALLAPLAPALGISLLEIEQGNKATQGRQGGH
jgi:hypothetical protein